MTDNISNEKLAFRLGELTDAVAENRVEKEFYMSIPARPDHDADLVMSLAASRLLEIDGYKSKIESLQAALLLSQESMVKLNGESKSLQANIDNQQFKIDNLMFEFCHNDMTNEQIENWKKYQVKVDQPSAE